MSSETETVFFLFSIQPDMSKKEEEHSFVADENNWRQVVETERNAVHAWFVFLFYLAHRLVWEKQALQLGRVLQGTHV